MDIVEAVNGLKQHLEQFAESAKEKLEQELPVVADIASKTAANPAFQALAAAEHLSGAPELLQTIADIIVKADAALAASKAQGAAEAQQAAAMPPPA